MKIRLHHTRYVHARHRVIPSTGCCGASPTRGVSHGRSAWPGPRCSTRVARHASSPSTQLADPRTQKQSQQAEETGEQHDDEAVRELRKRNAGHGQEAWTGRKPVQTGRGREGEECPNEQGPAHVPCSTSGASNTCTHSVHQWPTLPAQLLLHAQRLVDSLCRLAVHDPEGEA